MELKNKMKLESFTPLLFSLLLMANAATAKNIEILNKDSKAALVSIENVPLAQYYSEGTTLMNESASPQVIFISGDTVFKVSGPAKKDFIVQFENDRFIPQPPALAGAKRTISGLSLENNVERSEISTTKIPLAQYEARMKGEAPSSQPNTPCPSCPVCPTADKEAQKSLEDTNRAMAKNVQKLLQSLSMTIYKSIEQAANSKTFTALLTKYIRESDPNPFIFLEPKTIKELNDAVVNVIYQVKGHYVDYNTYLFNSTPILKAYETFIKERKNLEEQMKNASNHEQQVELLWKLVHSVPEYPAPKYTTPTNEEIKALKLK